MENDDDFTFGDFTFATATTSSSSNSAAQFSAPNDDGEEEDNEWGDFVSPSDKLSNNTSSNGTLLFDPLRSHTGSNQSELDMKIDYGAVKTDNRDSKGGAIPLSVFGEEENEEEEGSGSIAKLDNGSQADVSLFKKGSNSNVKTVGVNDIFASFYSTGEEKRYENDWSSGSIASNSSLIVPSKTGNGSSSNQNGSSSGLNGSNFNFDVLSVSGSHGMNPGMEVLSQNNEQTKVEYVSNLNSNGFNGWASDTRVVQENEEIETKNESKHNLSVIDVFGSDGMNLDMKVASQNVGNKVESGLGSSLNGWDFDLNFSMKVPSKSEQNIIQNGANPNFSAKENGPTLGSFDFGFSLNGSVMYTDRLYSDTNLINQDKQTKKDDGSNSNWYVSDFNNQMGSVANGWDTNKNSTEQEDEDDDGWEFQDARNGHVASEVEEGWGSELLGFGAGTATMKQEIQEEASTANLPEPEVDISNDISMKECENLEHVHEIMPKDQNRALPLTLFSEGSLEVDDSLNNHDTFSFKSTSNHRSEAKGLDSSISLTDLISSLYSQAEKTPSDKSEKVALDDTVCTPSVLDLDSSNNNDDFDDPSWEFKVVLSEPTAEDQTSVLSLGDTFQHSISKFQNNVEFFRELKDELCHVVIHHIGNTKRGGSSATFSKEEVEVDFPGAEEAYKVLEEEAVDLEVCQQNQPPRISRVNEFHEALLLPKFQVLDSAYDLRRRVSLVEKDIRSAIELLKDASKLLKVLSLGSAADQYNYVSTWSTIISVCAEEIKHGALVWKQSVQYNVHHEIITELRGQEFFHGLGEIYRVVQVIGAAAKIYKPWILLNSLDPASFFDQLEECFTLWKNSGLEEALRSLSNSIDNSLLESIQHIYDLDVMAVRNPILAQEDTICRLSLLTPDTVPGMKTVIWNGEHYFLTLANLWANMISSDPPKLPHIHVG